jgi:hypothetical protein
LNNEQVNDEITQSFLATVNSLASTDKRQAKHEETKEHFRKLVTHPEIDLKFYGGQHSVSDFMNFMMEKFEQVAPQIYEAIAAKTKCHRTCTKCGDVTSSAEQEWGANLCFTNQVLGWEAGGIVNMDPTTQEMCSKIIVEFEELMRANYNNTRKIQFTCRMCGPGHAWEHKCTSWGNVLPFSVARVTWQNKARYRIRNPLNLKEKITINTGEMGKEEEYELSALYLHSDRSGEFKKDKYCPLSISNGHYRALVKRGDLWFLTNDDMVTACSLKEILKNHGAKIMGGMYSKTIPIKHKTATKRKKASKHQNNVWNQHSLFGGQQQARQKGQNKMRNEKKESWSALQHAEFKAQHFPELCSNTDIAILCEEYDTATQERKSGAASTSEDKAPQECKSNAVSSSKDTATQDRKSGAASTCKDQAPQECESNAVSSS